jgi:hypothetical protein
MRNEEEAVELVTKLIRRSEERKVDWRPTADEDKFIATIGGNTFQIEYHAGDSWQNDHHALKMLDPNGRTIWQKSEDVTYESGTSDLPPRPSLKALYNLAQYKADNVEEKLNDALRSLDSL